MPYFIASDTIRSAIYGIGQTEEEAIANALAQCAELTDLIALPCSPALADKVGAEGGAVSWGEFSECAMTDEQEWWVKEPEGITALRDSINATSAQIDSGHFAYENASGWHWMTGAKFAKTIDLAERGLP